MLGFVIVTHLGIGREMRQAVEEILKEKVPMVVVEVDTLHATAEFQHQIELAISEFQNKDGVLILTDIFGATPTNLCKDLLAQERIAVVTGINLPMVLKAATAHFRQNAKEAAEFLKNYEKDTIKTSP